MHWPFSSKVVGFYGIKPHSEFSFPLSHQITYAHPDGTVFSDITTLTKVMAENSGVEEGILLVETKRNSAVILQKARQFVEHDLATMLERYGSKVVPNDNGATSPLQPYQALPIKEGKLVLGTYQSVLLATVRGKKPEISVTPVLGSVETRIIDTGTFMKPTYVCKESFYADSRGSEMVFDITELVKDAVGQPGKGVIYAGTGNTTCAIYYDEGEEGVEGIIRRLERIAPSAGRPYANDNCLEERRKRSQIPPDERQKGRAHVRAAILGSSLLLPPSAKGRVYLAELDGPMEGRQFHVGVARTPNSLSKAYK